MLKGGSWNCPRSYRRPRIDSDEAPMKPIVFSMLFLGPLTAQQPSDDPLREILFPPEAVMQHQQAIGLSDEQKNSFKTEVRHAQLKFTELQWTLQDELERLASLLKQPKVDEKQAASQ